MKYEIGYIGRWEQVPQPIAAIYDRDFEALKKLLENGLDINQEVKLSQWSRIYPIEVAVYQNDKEMLQTLLNYGANLDLASLDTAVRYADPEIVEMFVYQLKNLRKDEKFRLYCSIGWGQRFDNVNVLEKADLTVKEYGGEALRAAVSDGKTEYVRLLLEKGADINFCERDTVFCAGTTPVSVAVSKNRFDLVKELVERGADITICSQYGERPYDIALKTGNTEIAEYLKVHEPVEWHTEEGKEIALKPYRLAKEMVEYLKTQPLRLEFPQYTDVQWVELYSYMELKEMKWKRKKLLSIVRSMHNYGSNCKVLWNPKDCRLYGFDIEHEEMYPMCGWQDFIADPGKWLNPMVLGEFDPV